MKLLKDAPKYREHAENLQRQFPPDFLLRTVSSGMKQWVLQQLAFAVDVPTLTEELDAPSEDQTRAVLKVVFDHLRARV